MPLPLMTLDELFRSMHRDLEACFLHHQEALVCFHLTSARAWLKRYRALHDWHLAQEERFLIPLFDNAGVKRQWGGDLYLAEHRKLGTLLTEIENSLSALSGRDDLKPSEIITILDDERRLKGLEEHHHHREEQDLLPAVSQLPEAGELASRLHQGWQELIESLDTPPQEMKPQTLHY